MARLTHIWRHPIKSHGREALNSVNLAPGMTMPFDRAWAIYHEAAKVDPENPQWSRCSNFSRGAKSPALMAITAGLDEATGQLSLSHPNSETICVNPDVPQDADRLLHWVTALANPDRALPNGVIRVPERGMTDTDYPSVSLLSQSSRRDFSAKAGHELEMHRFRGNLWIDGLPAWEELRHIGKTCRIGAVELELHEPIERCLATTVNPQSGDRDFDTLAFLLQEWQHKNFGVHCIVRKGGPLNIGDPVEII